MPPNRIAFSVKVQSVEGKHHGATGGLPDSVLLRDWTRIELSTNGTGGQAASGTKTLEF